MLDKIFTVIAIICMSLLAVSVFIDILVHRLEIKKVKIEIKQLLEKGEQLRNDRSSKV